jgi:biopolymer transport protein ExbB/TolQ
MVRATRRFPEPLECKGSTVPKKSERSALLAILSSLGWPLILGTALGGIFYLLVFRGPLDVPLAHRYFAEHPVSFFATGMFFVGIAALLLKFLDIAGQYLALRVEYLAGPSASGQPVEDAGELLANVNQLPPAARQSYLGKRLADVLQFVGRKGTSEGLDDELKYLADLDVARQQESYGLVRIITWATPMLGFLGTVIGITQALGDLDPKQLATDIQVAMEGLLSGLYVAFDTTALALSLSIILMFIQFLIERFETQLLAIVDIRTNELIVGRFQQVGASHDPYLASVERMSQQLLRTSEQLVGQQAEIWAESINAAHDRWKDVVGTAGAQLTQSLQQALSESLHHHAAELATVEREASERAAKRWEQLQTGLSDNARSMRTQQEEMLRQGEVLNRVLRATGEVKRLEQVLNENLESLANVGNFEQTVMSLSAAIHLLSSRLNGFSDRSPRVDLEDSSSKGRAA